MTIEEICNKYIKVKATGKLALHQHPKQDGAFKIVLGKELDGCNGCFLEKYYPLRLPYICAAQEREDGKNVQFKKINKTMTREEAKELLPIIQAFAEGKTIQIKCGKYYDWDDVPKGVNDSITFENRPWKYRIKEEPKYRPFKTQEECWEEMHKHPDFGFIREKGTKVIYSIAMIDNFYLSTQDKSEHLCDTMDVYEFLDGEPFGIKDG